MNLDKQNQEFITCLERADDEEEVEACFVEHDQPFIEETDSRQLQKRVIEDKPTKAKRYIAEAGQELAEHTSEKTAHPEISRDYYDVHLATAGEQLWTAYNLLLEKRKGGEITPEKGFEAVEQWSEEIGERDPTWRKMHSLAKKLHLAHYDGGSSDQEMIDDITKTASLMNEEIKESRE